MTKVSKSNAIHHTREGVDAYYYQLPDISGGTTVAYAEFSDEHGQRIIGDRPRIYYVLEGQGEFEINEEKFAITEGDTIAVPPHSTYNFWPKDSVLKVLLYMELLDTSKLPK